MGCGVWGRQAPALGPVLTGHSVPPPQACRDFLELAETHSRKWQRALQYEQEQRIHLEETIEQLAKQHNSLERAFRSAPGRATNPTKSFSEGEWARTTLPGWVPCSGLLSLCSFQSVLCLHLLLPAGSAYTPPPGPPVHMPLNMPTLGLPRWLCISHTHYRRVIISLHLGSSSYEKSPVSPTVLCGRAALVPSGSPPGLGAGSAGSIRKGS